MIETIFTDQRILLAEGCSLDHLLLGRILVMGLRGEVYALGLQCHVD